MKVKIVDLQKKMEEGLIVRGLSQNDAALVATVYVEAELKEKKTHGLGKFFLLEEAIQAREGKPEVVKDKGNYALINAHRELGYISAEFATDILIKKAQEYDNAIVAVTNSFYYSMAGIYARKVAKAGFVSIILNNGGPMAVAPYGGIDPILGTNPIAIGIPGKDGPIVHDMATSEKTWGETNLAKVEKRQLQEKTFVDKDGKYTTDPYKVEAIVPFGGARGYGLNLMFEILTGALVGAKMGSRAQDGYDLGFLFLALSPTMFGSLEEFEKQVSALVVEIKGSRTIAGVVEVLIPGERSERLMKEKQATGFINISDNAWESLLAFAKGENVKEKIGLVE